MSMATVISASRGVLEAAEKWKAQYYNADTDSWDDVLNDESHSIYRQLKTLPDGAVPADVEAIVGNSSWVGGECQLCGEHTHELVVIDLPLGGHLLEACPECAKQLAKDIVSSLKAAK